MVGAILFAENNEGKTAFKYAEEKGHEEVAAYLKERMDESKRDRRGILGGIVGPYLSN